MFTYIIASFIAVAALLRRILRRMYGFSSFTEDEKKEIEKTLTGVSVGNGSGYKAILALLILVPLWYLALFPFSINVPSLQALQHSGMKVQEFLAKKREYEDFLRLFLGAIYFSILCLNYYILNYLIANKKSGAMLFFLISWLWPVVAWAIFMGMFFIGMMGG